MNDQDDPPTPMTARVAQHLLPNPMYNAGRAFNSGVTDAAADSYNPPVDALIVSYHRGWRKIRPLPEDAR